MVMRAIKPPEQMGMLMSAGSASSPLTRDVVGRENSSRWSLRLRRDFAAIRWVGKHFLIRPGEVLSRRL